MPHWQGERCSQWGSGLSIFDDDSEFPVPCEHRNQRGITIALIAKIHLGRANAQATDRHRLDGRGQAGIVDVQCMGWRIWF